jgi:hypothetical protein
MSASEGHRQEWEYADGPAVGEDIPVTSEPRAEERPGVPRAPAGSAEDSNGGDPGHGGSSPKEERTVLAEDPELSSETNERLTAELRDVVGTDRVEVPADRPHASRGEHPQQHGLAATLNMHRLQVVRATAIVLTFGAVVSLITGKWWLLPLAAGVHALGTMVVTITIIRMTTISEHPSPDVAAAMAEDGVRNPDEHFSRMVEEFRQEPERGTSEVLSPGHNEREAPADSDPAEASAEQSSAMTPTSQPSRPAGEGGAPDLVIWSTVASLFIVSIVLPAAGGGGWMWLLPAVMLPLLIGWVVFQRMMITNRNAVHVEGERGPLVAIVVCTAIAVAVFCALVAFAFQH